MAEIDMLGDAEFEKVIDEMGDDQLQLTKFVARQQFSTGKVLLDHGKRIKSLEAKNKKAMGIVGGASAIFATAVTAALDYFVRKG